MAALNCLSEAGFVICPRARDVIERARYVARLAMAECLREPVAKLAGNVETCLGHCSPGRPISARTRHPTKNAECHPFAYTITRLPTAGHRVLQGGDPALVVAPSRQTHA